MRHRAPTVLGEAMRRSKEKNRLNDLFASEPEYCYTLPGWKTPHKTTISFHQYCQRPRKKSQPISVMLLGGWRSTKTTAACNELRRVMLKYPGIEVAVFKYTLGEAKDSTMLTLLGDNTMPPVIERHLIGEDRTRSQGRPHFFLKNGSVCRLFGLMDRGKRAGKGLGAALIDDVYNPKKSKGEVSAKDYEYVHGRLSANVPERLLLLTSNPPPTRGHWMFEKFPEKATDYRALFHFDTYEAKAAGLIDAGYVEGLEAELGEIGAKRFLGGEVLFEEEGPAVFKGLYDENRHVMDVEPEPDRPLWIAIDFNNRPSATIHQYVPDRPVPAMWRTLYENYASGPMDIDVFADIVVAAGRELFPHNALDMRFCADHAGHQTTGVSRINKEGQRLHSYIEILRDMNIWCKTRPTPPGGIEQQHEIIRRKLRTHRGWAIHPRCTMLREALQGGYQRRVDSHGRILDEILKNDFEHLVSTMRYFGWNVVDTGGLLEVQMQQMDEHKPPGYFDAGTTPYGRAGSDAEEEFERAIGTGEFASYFQERG